MTTPTWTDAEERELQELQSRAAELAAQRDAFRQLHVSKLRALLEDLDPARYDPQPLSGSADLLADNADELVELLKPFTKEPAA